MIKAERGLQGLLLAGLALAAVGSASCQRPPEATPLPQRTPLAAPGEPIPSDIEAEIQARVRATVTAQKPASQAARPAEVQKPAVEKPVEPGWTTFRSINYPYQIDYPSDWTLGNLKLGGKLYDGFDGPTINGIMTNVQIFSRIVDNYVASEDYGISKRNELQQQWGGVSASMNAFDQKAGVQKTFLITTNDINISNSPMRISSVVFVKDRKAWEINFITSSNTNIAPIIKKMFASFKFLR